MHYFVQEFANYFLHTSEVTFDLADHLDVTFCLAYGDGVNNIDIAALTAHHKGMKTESTLPAVQPAGRFGP